MTTPHRITVNRSPSRNLPLVGTDHEFARFLELRQGIEPPRRFARLRAMFRRGT